MFRFFVLLILSSYGALAQIRIDGKIIDSETSEAVSYASVGIVGVSRGTSANVNGDFSIHISENNALKITSVGYESIVIDIPISGLIIKLKPTTINLQEVYVFDKDLTPQGIVKKAFKNIRKNYNPNAFVQKFFYRHYCKDDSIYGRLIEAAVDLYKRKGYNAWQSNPGEKEEMRVTQLRRSFDRTKLAGSHLPIAISSALSSDIVGYQSKSKSPFMSYFSTNNLKTNSKIYDLKMNGITSYDGHEVFEIHFSTKDSVITSAGILLKIYNKGKLFITTDKYAIVKSELTNVRPNDTTQIAIYYRQYGKYFYPHHIIRDSKNKVNNLPHHVHLELTSTEILEKKYEKFRGKEPARETLAKMPFDSIFWTNYDILKTTQLEDKIIADLGGGKSLDEQFVFFQKLEETGILEAQENEKKFNEFRELCRGRKILYIDFWASWCGPCIVQFIHEKKLLEQYKNKISFVLLSVDNDKEKWKKAVKKYELNTGGFINYWIGSQSDAALFYDVNSIPRYILIDKRGNHFDLNAKRPIDSLLKEDFDKLTNVHEP